MQIPDDSINATFLQDCSKQDDDGGVFISDEEEDNDDNEYEYDGYDCMIDRYTPGWQIAKSNAVNIAR